MATVNVPVVGGVLNPSQVDALETTLDLTFAANIRLYEADIQPSRVVLTSSSATLLADITTWLNAQWPAIFASVPSIAPVNVIDRWQASMPISAGDSVRTPFGAILERLAGGVTGTTFDAAEAAEYRVTLLGGPRTYPGAGFYVFSGDQIEFEGEVYARVDEGVTGSLTFDETERCEWIRLSEARNLKLWFGGVAYAQFQEVVSPGGALLQAKRAHTSQPTLDASEADNWLRRGHVDVGAFKDDTYYWSGDEMLDSGTLYRRIGDGATAPATNFASDSANWLPLSGGGAAVSVPPFTAWAASISVLQGTDYITPGGAIVERTAADGTTGATYNATEAGSYALRSLGATGNFQASTYYYAGQQIVDGGTLYRRSATGVSGATFTADAANWTELAGSASGIEDWTASNAYMAGDFVLSPTGALLERTAAGTSGATFDATEVANWTVRGHLLTGGFVATTFYDAGDRIRVAGVVYQRTTAGTSAADFATDASNWEPWTGLPSVQALDNSSTTVAWNAGAINRAQLVMNAAAMTLSNVTNARVGEDYYLLVRNSSGGEATLTFDTLYIDGQTGEQRDTLTLPAGNFAALHFLSDSARMLDVGGTLPETPVAAFETLADVTNDGDTLTWDVAASRSASVTTVRADFVLATTGSPERGKRYVFGVNTIGSPSAVDVTFPATFFTEAGDPLGTLTFAQNKAAGIEFTSYDGTNFTRSNAYGFSDAAGSLEIQNVTSTAGGTVAFDATLGEILNVTGAAPAGNAAQIQAPTNLTAGARYAVQLAGNAGEGVSEYVLADPYLGVDRVRVSEGETLRLDFYSPDGTNLAVQPRDVFFEADVGLDGNATARHDVCRFTGPGAFMGFSGEVQILDDSLTEQPTNVYPLSFGFNSAGNADKLVPLQLDSGNADLGTILLSLETDSGQSLLKVWRAAAATTKTYRVRVVGKAYTAPLPSDSNSVSGTIPTDSLYTRASATALSAQPQDLVQEASGAVRKLSIHSIDRWKADAATVTAFDSTTTPADGNANLSATGITFVSPFFDGSLTLVSVNIRHQVATTPTALALYEGTGLAGTKLATSDTVNVTTTFAPVLFTFAGATIEAGKTYTIGLDTPGVEHEIETILAAPLTNVGLSATPGSAPFATITASLDYEYLVTSASDGGLGQTELGGAVSRVLASRVDGGELLDWSAGVPAGYTQLPLAANGIDTTLAELEPLTADRMIPAGGFSIFQQVAADDGTAGTEVFALTNPAGDALLSLEIDREAANGYGTAVRVTDQAGRGFTMGWGNGSNGLPNDEWGFIRDTNERVLGGTAANADLHAVAGLSTGAANFSDSVLSFFEVNKSMGLGYTAVTAAATNLDSTHFIIDADTSSNAVLLSLPAIAAADRRVYMVRVEDATNPTTLAPQTGESLDGVTDGTLQLTTTGDFLMVQATATGWRTLFKVLSGTRDFEPRGEITADPAPALWGSNYIADTSGGDFVFTLDAATASSGAILLTVKGGNRVTITPAASESINGVPDTPVYASVDESQWLITAAGAGQSIVTRFGEGTSTNSPDVYIEGQVLDHTTTDDDEDFELLDVNALIADTANPDFDVDPANNVLGVATATGAGLTFPAGHWKHVLYIDHPATPGTTSGATVADVGNFTARLRVNGRETFGNYTQGVGDDGSGLPEFATIVVEQFYTEPTLVEVGIRSALNAAGIESFAIRWSAYRTEPTRYLPAGAAELEQLPMARLLLSADSAAAEVCPFDEIQTAQPSLFQLETSGAGADPDGTLTIVEAGRYRFLPNATRSASVVDYELWDVTNGVQVEQFLSDTGGAQGSLMPVYVDVVAGQRFQIRETGADAAVVWNGRSATSGTPVEPWSSWLLVEKVASYSALAPIEVTDPTRVFLGATTLGSATPNAPLLADVQAYIDGVSLTSQFLYYTGTDVDTDPTIRLYLVDNAGKVELIQGSSATVESAAVDASAAPVTITLPAATGAGQILRYHATDLTNGATLGVEPGESLAGTVDGTFSFNVYAVDTLIEAVDVGTGEWAVSVIGAPTETDRLYHAQGVLDDYGPVSGLNVVDFTTLVAGPGPYSLSETDALGWRTSADTLTVPTGAEGLYRIAVRLWHPSDGDAIIGSNNQVGLGSPYPIVEIDGTLIGIGGVDNFAGAPEAPSGATELELTAGMALRVGYSGGTSETNEDFFVSVTIEPVSRTEVTLAGMAPTESLKTVLGTGLDPNAIAISQTWDSLAASGYESVLFEFWETDADGGIASYVHTPSATFPVELFTNPSATGTNIRLVMGGALNSDVGLDLGVLPSTMTATLVASGGNIAPLAAYRWRVSGIKPQKTVVNPDLVVPETLSKLFVKRNDDGTAAQGGLGAGTGTTYADAVPVDFNVGTSLQDSGGMLDGANGQLVAPVDGYYVLSGSLTIDDGGGANTRFRVIVGDTATEVWAIEESITAGFAANIPFHYEQQLSAGDRLDVRVASDSTNTGSLTAFSLSFQGQPSSSVIYVDPALTEARTLGRIKARQTTSQAITANVVTPLTFQAADFNVGFTFTAGATSIPIPRTAYYSVLGHWSSTTAIGNQQIELQVNGASVKRTLDSTTSGIKSNVHAASLLLNAGDTVSIAAFSGANGATGGTTTADEAILEIVELPTTEVVTPGDLPVEDVRTELFTVTPTSTTTAFTLPGGQTWQDLANEYERLEAQVVSGYNSHVIHSFLDINELLTSSSNSWALDQLLADSNTNITMRLTGINAASTGGSLASPNSTPSGRLVVWGIKAQKTVLNTAAVPVDNTGQVNGGFLKWNEALGTYEPYSGAVVSSGTDPIRESVFGSYGRGVPSAGTSAANGSTVSIPLGSTVEGGSITYNSTLQGFDVPDGTVVEITGEIFKASNISAPSVHLVTAVTNGDSNITGLHVGTLPVGSTTGYLAVQGIYENDTGVTVTIAATVTGAGNTGSSGAGGYLQVRQIN